MNSFFTVALLCAASLMNSVSLGSLVGGSSGGSGILSTPETTESASSGGSTGSNGQSGGDGTWTTGSPGSGPSSTNAGQGVGSGSSSGSEQFPHWYFGGPYGGNYPGGYWVPSTGGFPWGYHGGYFRGYLGSYPGFNAGFAGHNFGVSPYVTAGPYGFGFGNQHAGSWGLRYAPGVGGYHSGFGTLGGHHLFRFGAPGVHPGAFGHSFHRGNHRHGPSQATVGISASRQGAVRGVLGC